MKYRTLTPAELEAYEIGYKVGSRKIIITDIEWESETEHSIYRKGYMAGLMDFKRNVSNVSNVSNVNSYNSDKVKDKVKDRVKVKDKVMVMENKGGVGEKETIDTNARKNATDALLNKIAKSLGVPPTGATQIGKTPIPSAMKEFLDAEFKPAEITRLKRWLAENKSGELMKNESILRAICTISNKNYADVASRFLRFGMK